MDSNDKFLVDLTYSQANGDSFEKVQAGGYCYVGYNGNIHTYPSDTAKVDVKISLTADSDSGCTWPPYTTSSSALGAMIVMPLNGSPTLSPANFGYKNDAHSIHFTMPNPNSTQLGNSDVPLLYDLTLNVDCSGQIYTLKIQSGHGTIDPDIVNH